MKLRERDNEILPRVETHPSPMEAALAGLWASVLQVEHVPQGEDFFSLGGNSTAFASLIASVKVLFGVDLKIESLCGDAATVERMALEIEAARAEAATGGHPDSEKNEQVQRSIE